MRGKYTKQRSKFRWLSVAFAVCCGFILSPYVQAFTIAQTPQSSQLLARNPLEYGRSTLADDTNLRIAQPRSTASSTSRAALYVRRIKLAGNTVFDTPTLHALLADAEGKTLTLGQLNQLAARISHYYQQHDYPFSRAYVPAQNINCGVVQFNIVEARYGAICIKNTSRLSPYRANLMLNALHSQDRIRSSTLNRNLLLLNDLPGITTCSTLGPGQTPGSSDLHVLIKDDRPINGFVGVDNYGSPYTGRTRYNASLQFNNPSGQGDQIAVDALSSGRHLMYGHVAYVFPLDPGFKVGTNYYAMKYRLKNSLDPLQAEGNLDIADVWLSYDWVRQVNVNFSSSLRYVYKNMQDNVKAVGIYNRRYSNAIKLENSADFSDPYGRSNAYLSITQGSLSDGAELDRLGGRTAGAFTKLNLHLSREQQFAQGTSLYLAGDGQLANKNLDSSEQFILGGPFVVRSYDLGAISGTQGYTATAELRHILKLPISGTWRPMLFVDAGRVQIYKHPLFTRDPKVFSLYSSGFGLDVNWQGWVLSGRFAHRLGARLPSVIASQVDKNQLWIQFGKSF